MMPLRFPFPRYARIAMVWSGAEKVVLAVTIALLLAACSASGHTISGSFVLTDPGVARTGTTCSGTGGYSDIGDGTDVTVKDGAGKVIGTGRLSTNVEGSQDTGCAYDFTVAVPDADFYVVAVSHRGELTYSRDEMQQHDWKVGFTLGK
jgi:hypothetical protein